MRVRNTGKREDKIELQMTPMIDIVFQLLVFFIMTFKIVLPEGDFNIKMPRNAPATGEPDENLTEQVTVKLTATDEGNLRGIRFQETQLTGSTEQQLFNELHSRLFSLVGTEQGPDSRAANTEVELDPDYNLKYKYIIKALTEVSGYVTGDGEVVKLIEKIKFKPPKKNE